MLRLGWVGWILGLWLLVGLSQADYVGQSVTGVVEEGNYTYYSLRQDGKVVLQLKTISGDADLYLSSVHERPSYHHDEYEMLSATCGEDLVTIPPSTPRPVHIAVYGHPRHSSSEFILDVIVVEEEEEFDYFKQDDSYYMSDDEKSEKERRRRESDEHGREEGSNGKLIWTILWQILEIIIDVLI